MISTANADRSMEFTRGLIIVDVIIVAGAVALAVFLFWSPRSSDQEIKPVHQSPEQIVIENPTK